MQSTHEREELLGKEISNVVGVEMTKEDTIHDHDYEVLDTDCMSSFFQSCSICKGKIWSVCCVFCGCFGCGPLIRVPEGHKAAVLKFGKLDRILSPGSYHRNIGSEEFKLCPVTVITMPISKQLVMTRDNVSLVLDAVCFYQVVDVKSALFNVKNYSKATKNLAQSTMETIIAQHTMDELVSARAEITNKTTVLLDKYTINWGIKVRGLELKDIRIPDDMQRVMAITAEAQREGQANVIMAEADLLAADTFAKAATYMSSPVALQLRYFQTLKEISAKNNKTIIIPSEFTNMTRGLRKWDQSDAFSGNLDSEVVENIKIFVEHQKKNNL